MADRTYFYKYSELGDWNVKIEDVSVQGDPAIFSDTSYASLAAVVEKGASARFVVKANVRLQKDDPNTGTETFDAYFKRRIQFASTVQALKGAAGHLTVISDRSTDQTTTTGSVSPATPATIPVTAMVGLAVNDLALVTNSSTNVYEIVTITAVNTSALTYEANTTITLNSGGVVAKLHWYLPNCYLMGDVNVGGEEGAGSRVSNDIEFTFEGVDVPVFQT